MQKKVKTYIKLIKRLINLNLLVINPLYDVSNQYSLAKLNFIFIDPLDYIKTLKQFIRSLQFLNYLHSSILYLEIDNNKFENFVSLLQQNSSKKYKIRYLDTVRKKKKNFYSAIYIYLKQNIFASEYFKTLFKKQFYIIYSVNTNFEKNKLGFYKFYSEFDEIKKLTFLISILKNFYNKSTV